MKISPDAVINLLHDASYGTLATHSTQAPGFPYPTVVPYVPDSTHAPVLCISLLAEHTKNVLADPRVGFSICRPGASDVQDAERMTLVAVAERIEPNTVLLERYLRYAPKTEPLLALDFQFFRLVPKRIRFIAGLGRMGWVDETDWQSLHILPDALETQFMTAAAQSPRSALRILGADCYGIDFERAGQRQRQPFPDAPLSAEVFPSAALRTARSVD